MSKDTKVPKHVDCRKCPAFGDIPVDDTSKMSKKEKNQYLGSLTNADIRGCKLPKGYQCPYKCK